MNIKEIRIKNLHCDQLEELLDELRGTQKRFVIIGDITAQSYKEIHELAERKKLFIGIVTEEQNEHQNCYIIKNFGNTFVCSMNIKRNKKHERPNSKD